MKRLLYILSLLLSSALIIYTAYTGEGESDTRPESLTGKVVSVADGDTFTLLTDNNGRMKVRLYAIDAPERGQDFGTKSREFLNDLCYGKTVTIEKKDTDQYGRILGIAFVDGMNLNEEMVRNGLAWYYSHYVDDPKLDALEQSARRQKLNIWSMKNPVHPHEFRKNKRNNGK
ncbi:thermonuclease family protein [Dysgonomonas termitidis]|uniref:Thermonuclease family protein n=1 Tax=Dysgonomonas termitidis TaxID=1516126 RepID=A0ABV9L1Z6_9BACT